MIKSLTVFDPKKVFTEVIKPNSAVLQQREAIQPYHGDYVPTLQGCLQTHKVFLHKRLFMHVPLKSWANGFRIKDTPVDRFTGRVCKKKKKVFMGKCHRGKVYDFLEEYSPLPPEIADMCVLRAR